LGLVIKNKCLFVKQVRLWESESANCIGVGIGHMGAVGSIAFSKRKRDFFVSGSRWVL